MKHFIVYTSRYSRYGIHIHADSFIADEEHYEIIFYIGTDIIAVFPLNEVNSVDRI